MQKVALVFITHDIVMAARIADEIIVMQSGRIVEQGPAKQIIEAPEQHATRALLAGAVGLNSMVGKRPSA